jgi:hypothetical protein
MRASRRTATSVVVPAAILRDARQRGALLRMRSIGLQLRGYGKGLLMSNGLPSKLDEIIFSFTREEWRKAAFVISKTLHYCEDNNVKAADEMIADRVRFLCKTGDLEAQGNLSDWRHSEVRLSKRRATS